MTTIFHEFTLYHKDDKDDKDRYSLLCIECKKETPHSTVCSYNEEYQRISDMNTSDWSRKNQIIQCQNCKSVSFRTITTDSEIDYDIPYPKEVIKYYPDLITTPDPNQDLPYGIQEDYQEAQAIFFRSPRGAAALLRLAIQKLCKHLGEKGKNINDDIAALVKKGHLAQNQQAFDIIRIVGNNAVHPGELDLKNDPKTVNTLFQLTNLIAESMITHPKKVKQVNALYDKIIPFTEKERITNRDTNKTKHTNKKNVA